MSEANVKDHLKSTVNDGLSPPLTMYLSALSCLVLPGGVPGIMSEA